MQPRATTDRMESDWFQRLDEAIKRDGRSMRRISAEAGYGPNFLQQTLKHGRDMGAGKLMDVLEVLGPGVSYYVLTGIEMTEEDYEALTVLSSLTPSVRHSALQLIQTLASSAAQPEPSPDLQGSTSSTLPESK